eukprot:5566732-Pyramimonas_sp.AAC.1
MNAKCVNKGMATTVEDARILQQQHRFACCSLSYTSARSKPRDLERAEMHKPIRGHHSRWLNRTVSEEVVAHGVRLCNYRATRPLQHVHRSTEIEVRGVKVSARHLIYLNRSIQCGNPPEIVELPTTRALPGVRETVRPLDGYTSRGTQAFLPPRVPCSLLSANHHRSTEGLISYIDDPAPTALSIRNCTVMTVSLYCSLQ